LACSTTVTTLPIQTDLVIRGGFDDVVEVDEGVFDSTPWVASGSPYLSSFLISPTITQSGRGSWYPNMINCYNTGSSCTAIVAQDLTINAPDVAYNFGLWYRVWGWFPSGPLTGNCQLIATLAGTVMYTGTFDNSNVKTDGWHQVSVPNIVPGSTAAKLSLTFVCDPNYVGQNGHIQFFVDTVTLTPVDTPTAIVTTVTKCDTPTPASSIPSSSGTP
jgi:hypothetical protein